MTTYETNEDPLFKADFESFTQAGAPAELVALTAPLLRSEMNGGSTAAVGAAGQFLHRHSGGGPIRDRADSQRARAQAEALLTQFGQKPDPAILRRYAPDEAAVNKTWDEQTPGQLLGVDPASW